MSIHKLGVYCQVDDACTILTIYPPIKQFSTNPTNELFILNVTNRTGSDNRIFSMDGNKYWTTNGIVQERTWTLYWGSYMNETSDLFMFQIPENYPSSTNDISSIYYIFIGCNYDKQLISFPSFNTSIYNTLIVFVDHVSAFTAPKSFICPSVTNCILICLDGWAYRTKSCWHLRGNFSLAHNGVLLSGSAHMTIYGSSNSFRISFWKMSMGASHGNFYLENTTQIIWDCDCTNVGYECSCGGYTNLYTGLSLDVTLLCGEQGCENLTLYSDLNPNQYLLYTLWNINCNSYWSESCKNFVLNFNNSQSCIYYNSTNTNCTKFTYNSEPTIDPTTNPNMDPTSNSNQNPTVDTEIDGAGDRNDQLFGLETGEQYIVFGGLLFVFILLMIVCAVCYVVRIKKKSDQKLVQRQHVSAVSSENQTSINDIDGRDNTFPFLNTTQTITELVSNEMDLKTDADNALITADKKNPNGAQIGIYPPNRS